MNIFLDLIRCPRVSYDDNDCHILVSELKDQKIVDQFILKNSTLNFEKALFELFSYKKVIQLNKIGITFGEQMTDFIYWYIDRIIKNKDNISRADFQEIFRYKYPNNNYNIETRNIVISFVKYETNDLTKNKLPTWVLLDFTFNYPEVLPSNRWDFLIKDTIGNYELNKDGIAENRIERLMSGLLLECFTQRPYAKKIRINYGKSIMNFIKPKKGEKNEKN